MRRLPLAFFTLGALCGAAGMIWGMLMARADNFTMAPAHAHLNLLGWATLSLMGAFYALAGERGPVRIGWLNFVLSGAGVIVTIPFLARMLAGDRSAETFVAAGSGLVFAGMLAFLAALALVWRTAGRAASA